MRRYGKFMIFEWNGDDALDQVPGFADLDPDALAVGVETFVTQLARRRGQIKNTLTNQKFLVGIGNAYSDEILWEVRLRPISAARRSTMMTAAGSIALSP